MIERLTVPVIEKLIVTLKGDLRSFDLYTGCVASFSCVELFLIPGLSSTFKKVFKTLLQKVVIKIILWLPRRNILDFFQFFTAEHEDFGSFSPISFFSGRLLSMTLASIVTDWFAVLTSNSWSITTVARRVQAEIKLTNIFSGVTCSYMVEETRVLLDKQRPWTVVDSYLPHVHHPFCSNGLRTT